MPRMMISLRLMLNSDVVTWNGGTWVGDKLELSGSKVEQQQHEQGVEDVDDIVMANTSLI